MQFDFIAEAQQFLANLLGPLIFIIVVISAFKWRP